MFGPEDLDTLVAAARDVVERDPVAAMGWATAAQSQLRDKDLRCTQATLLAARACLLLGVLGDRRPRWSARLCGFGASVHWRDADQ